MRWSAVSGVLSQFHAAGLCYEFRFHLPNNCSRRSERISIRLVQNRAQVCRAGAKWIWRLLQTVLQIEVSEEVQGEHAVT